MDIKEQLDSVLAKSIKYVRRQLNDIPKELKNFYLLYLSNDLLTLINNNAWYFIDGEKD